DKFGQSGKPDELLEVYGLNANAIVESTQKVIARKNA
ncbi:MAG: transketolase, partial [Bacteroidetes bacterium CG_4_8_14_3_um_filter_31_14]